MNNNNNNNILLENKISFDPKINQCMYYLKKNGKMLHYNMNSYNKYLCIISGYLNFNFNYFPLLEDKNEHYIIKKLLVLKYLQNNNLKYIIFNKNKTIYYINTDYICSFKENNIDKIIRFIYYYDVILYDYNKYKIIYPLDKKKHIKTKTKTKTKTSKKIDLYGVNILNYMSFLYITNKLIFKKISNNTNFIKIFYECYISHIDVELKDKYNVSIHDFPNYHELYLFLKKKGYVKKYYNHFTQKIIKNANKLEEKAFKNMSEYEAFKNEKLKEIKSYKDIDLFDLIKNNLNKKFDKRFIKNKFIELCKKYNI
jgi:hypothetical protein